MNKILYPPLIFIGSSIPIYIYALIDRSVDSIVTACIWSLLLLFTTVRLNFTKAKAGGHLPAFD